MGCLTLPSPLGLKKGEGVVPSYRSLRRLLRFHRFFFLLHLTLSTLHYQLCHFQSLQLNDLSIKPSPREVTLSMRIHFFFNLLQHILQKTMSYRQSPSLTSSSEMSTASLGTHILENANERRAPKPLQMGA